LKKEKSKLFDFSFISKQEKKNVKEIMIDYIKSKSDLRFEYLKLKDYKLVE